MPLRDNAVAHALLTLGRISGTLSERGRRGLGRILGNAMMAASAKRRFITSENLRHAFPDLSVDRRDNIMRGAYHNLGIVLAEVLALPSMSSDAVKSRVRFENIDALRVRVEQGLPSILVSGHYGNWEYLALAGALQLDTSFTIVVHPQSNAKVSAILNAYRTRFGNTVVSMHDAARALVRSIRDGGTIAFLVDQHADPGRDSWIRFFGRPTPTYDAPAALALRYNIPIFSTFAERLDDGSYLAPLHQIPMDDLENTPAGIRTLTERHVRALEDAVRKRPELWSWQHRRWRDEQPPT